MADLKFFNNSGPYTLQHLADYVGGTLILGEGHSPSDLCHSVGTLSMASPDDLTFVHGALYWEQLKSSKAKICIIHEDSIDRAPKHLSLISSKSPYRDYANIATLFYGEKPSEKTLIDPTAHVHPTAKIGPGTRIGPGCFVGENVEIGEGSLLYNHVTVTHAIVGKGAVILPGARIGQQGFGFFMDEKGHISVPQLGRVIIGDDVEIGANTTIDRGTLEDTVIGDGCRLDNLVQVGHNVRLGRGCAIAAQVGISGSTKLGDYVIVGGQVGFSGHITIGSRVKIAAQSGVISDIPDGQTYGGTPASPINDWKRQTIALRQLIKRDKTK